MVPALISSAQCVGFSGSRFPNGVIPPSALLGAITAVSRSVSVMVGCAKGVDAVVRQAFGDRCQVFSVTSGQWVSGRGAETGRSTTSRGRWFVVFLCPRYCSAVTVLVSTLR